MKEIHLATLQKKISTASSIQYPFPSLCHHTRQSDGRLVEISPITLPDAWLMAWLNESKRKIKGDIVVPAEDNQRCQVLSGMTYLLDTHIWLWILLEWSKLDEDII